jgi:hypothetical protein
MAEKKSEKLTGWKAIAEFLGQPLSVAQRWAGSGMPVEREGRRVYASPDELNRWLGRQSSNEPLHIASETDDLSTELKRGLAYIRKQEKK